MVALPSSLLDLTARTFRPARRLGGAHAQTLYATYFPVRAPRARWERWDTPDGDYLDVQVTPAPPDAPQVLLLHGLASDPHAAYMRRMARALATRGMGTWSPTFRGCGAEPHRQLRTWNAAETSDTRFLLERIRARTTGPLLAVGFSLGASVLLRTLVEDGDASPLVGAAAVSTPFDLAASADALDGAPLTDLLVGYRARFLLHLVRRGLEADARHPGIADRDALRRARTLRAYDDAFTARVLGLGTAQAYYEHASVGRRLTALRVPTLVVSAEDDPLIPPRTIPRFDDSPYVVPVISERGGHVAFVEGSPLRPRFYCESLVADAFTALLRGR